VSTGCSEHSVKVGIRSLVYGETDLVEAVQRGVVGGEAVLNAQMRRNGGCKLEGGFGQAQVSFDAAVLSDVNVPSSTMAVGPFERCAQMLQIPSFGV
jgi:hypothetical protein